MGSYEAVKVRLDPTPRQERLMASHAGAARFAYNAGLAHVKEALDRVSLPTGRTTLYAAGGTQIKTF